MKRSWIYSVVGLMALALVGVGAIQYYLFQNTVKLKEAQFSYSVNMALNEVSEEVQRFETKERILSNRQSRKALHRLDSIQRVMASGWTRDNGYYVKDTVILTDEGTLQMSYTAYTDLGEERELISEVDFESGLGSVMDPFWIEDMISGVFDMQRMRPFDERMDFTEMDSIIHRIFHGFGIDTDVDFAVFNAFGQPVLFDRASDMKPLVSLSKSDYRVRINPNQLMSDPLYLHIGFPSERSYVMTTLRPLLFSSAGLMIIIMAAFAFTVYIILRQKRVSEIKNDFINNMTHELKTPVSTIALACEALSDPDMRSIQGSTDRYVGMIRDENRRLGTLVESVLQTAIVDRGELRLKKEHIHLHGLIQEAVDHIRLALNKRQGSITLELKAIEDGLWADEVHVQNIIGNLLDNAMKYSPEDPDIHIQTAKEGEFIRLSVSDKGVGISKEHLKRIFDKLYRVPTGNTHDVKGFGLGLSYVKAVVDKHCGHIEVHSEPGSGSRFDIYLPVDEE
ncbi:MAG: HAMP domain-containing histidine kinase [Flavobacteriales bacterium]|nr:HAMP domain-containing histidine kinase [Flavobacteriales bacterium]